jgi:hypothetical protein
MLSSKCATPCGTLCTWQLGLPVRTSTTPPVHPAVDTLSAKADSTDYSAFPDHGTLGSSFQVLNQMLSSSISVLRSSSAPPLDLFRSNRSARITRQSSGDAFARSRNPIPIHRGLRSLNPYYSAFIKCTAHTIVPVIAIISSVALPAGLSAAETNYYGGPTRPVTIYHSFAP